MERVSVFLLLVPKKATKRSIYPNLPSVEDVKWLHKSEPGGDEWVTLGRAAQALFVLRQGGVEQQVSVAQHS